jgi:acyl-CoA thioester hydrolase
MRPPAIPIDKITALAPACLRMTVPAEWADFNGHMNMRWYLAVYDDAGDVWHDRMGLTAEFHKPRNTGTVDFEHHIHFLNEVMPGDTIAVYVRVAAFTPKRVHYLLFMVNETRGKLASIFECMNGFMDRTLRKTAPFPAEIAGRLQAEAEKSEALDWPPPLCGAMRP